MTHEVVDLNNLRAEHLKPLLQQKFRVNVPNMPPTEMTLVEVNIKEHLLPQKDREAGLKAPFNVLFVAEPNTYYINQGIVRLEHETFGILEIFLVPLGFDSVTKGMRYESIFN